MGASRQFRSHLVEVVLGQVDARSVGPDDHEWGVIAGEHASGGRDEHFGVESIGQGQFLPESRVQGRCPGSAASRPSTDQQMMTETREILPCRTAQRSLVAGDFTPLRCQHLARTHRLTVDDDLHALGVIAHPLSGNPTQPGQWNRAIVAGPSDQFNTASTISSHGVESVGEVGAVTLRVRSGALQACRPICMYLFGKG